MNSSNLKEIFQDTLKFLFEPLIDPVSGIGEPERKTTSWIYLFKLIKTVYQNTNTIGKLIIVPPFALFFGVAASIIFLIKILIVLVVLLLWALSGIIWTIFKRIFLKSEKK